MSWHRTLALVVVVAFLYLRGSLAPGQATVPEAPLPVRVAVTALLLLVCAAIAIHLWLRWRRTGHGLTDPGTDSPPFSVARPWARVVLCAGVCVLSGLLVLTALVG